MHKEKQIARSGDTYKKNQGVGGSFFKPAVQPKSEANKSDEHSTKIDTPTFFSQANSVQRKQGAGDGLTNTVQQESVPSIQRNPNPPGWDELHNYKHPGSVKVRLTHFKTSNAASDPFNDYAAKAKSMLQEHNLGLDIVEGGDIDFQTPLQDMDDVKNLRMAAHKKFQDTTPRLPVISAVYSSVKGFDASDLNGQAIKNTDWLPFVILNSANKSADSVTLLHEAGHAANVPGNTDLPVGPNDIVENFMLYGNNRTDMLKQQVIALATAYFSG